MPCVDDTRNANRAPNTFAGNGNRAPCQGVPVNDNDVFSCEDFGGVPLRDFSEGLAVARHFGWNAPCCYNGHDGGRSDVNAWEYTGPDPDYELNPDGSKIFTIVEWIPDGAHQMYYEGWDHEGNELLEPNERTPVPAFLPPKHPGKPCSLRYPHDYRRMHLCLCDTRGPPAAPPGAPLPPRAPPSSPPSPAPAAPQLYQALTLNPFQTCAEAGLTDIPDEAGCEAAANWYDAHPFVGGTTTLSGGSVPWGGTLTSTTNPNINALPWPDCFKLNDLGSVLHGKVFEQQRAQRLQPGATEAREDLAPNTCFRFA